MRQFENNSIAIVRHKATCTKTVQSLLSYARVSLENCSIRFVDKLTSYIMKDMLSSNL